jgi:predicted type IV restriction endonuclease
MPAPQAILDLVQRFQDNLAAYKSPKYNEATQRMEFLNPFFEALGWDI